MRLWRRLEKRLAAGPVGGWSDLWHRRRARPDEATVVTGFFRSGTTILLEILEQLAGARSFFEPLSSRVPEARPFHSPHRFQARGRTVTETCPYVRPDAPSSPLDAFLHRILTGRVSTPWTRKARLLRSALQPRVLVKLARGNLLAAYLQRRFSCRTLLLLRHPAAVIASIRRGRTNRAILESEQYLRVYLDQEALVGDHLLPHLDHIGRWSTTPLGRLALGWAIANLVPLRQAKEGSWRPCIVRFEEIALAPETALEPACAALGIAPPPGTAARLLRRDSLTTKREREGVAPLARSNAWKKELSRAEIDAVYAIAAGFGEPLTAAVAEIDALTDRVAAP